MKILLLSFSYPPNSNPGSLRAQTIVNALQKYGPADLQIHVITSTIGTQKLKHFLGSLFRT